jgi:uncharacterized GH25 family protein
MAKEPSEREHSRERSDAPWSRILGHRLEIVPEVDPADGALGGAFRARVLFEGQPLAGALVQAFPGPLRAETDRDGRIRFDLPHGGAWLVSVVHMVPCASCGRSDWESAWASLTFFRTEIQSTSASRTR